MGTSRSLCIPIRLQDGLSNPDDHASAETIRGLLPSLLGLTGSKPVRRILSNRARRMEHFRANLFGEPAWDMLLELYASAIEQRRISITSLCIASGVPATTALRWISVLERERLVERRNDPLDGRRAYMSLSTKGLDAMFAYFRRMTSEQSPADSNFGCCCKCHTRSKSEPR